MSRQEAYEPACAACKGAVELLIQGRSKDLGGFGILRVLPSPVRKTVGPFIFFDEMGPADCAPGEGINVRPHPHIGLATVTYLFDGEILHRDSLGHVQRIRPGAVNLMTAGRGIVHSERTPEELASKQHGLHGIQTWMALPDDLQEIDPAFVHHAKDELPVISDVGVTTTVIVGVFFGERSPVATHAQTIYLDLRMEAGASIALPSDIEERGVFVVDGEVAVGEELLSAGSMEVLRPGEAILEANRASHIMIVGGESVGPRYIWWNFVHSSHERIDKAKRDWLDEAFGKVPNDDEFIPLPAS
ncbi:MAG: pirin family protein [Acidobacteriota bacterium]